MTNWQDKYKDLEVGQVAWYWHKSDIGGKLCQYPVQVHIWRSMQDGYTALWGESLRESMSVSEDFPNGPRCLTPDDVIKLIDINVVANYEVALGRNRGFQFVDNQGNVIPCKTEQE